MSTINSVLGPIDTANLGFTLSHEHVQVASAGIQQVFPEFLDREGTVETGVAKLGEAYAEGVRTIVDLTTIDIGRDIRMIEEVSRRSGMQIIAATGCWRDIPRVFWSASPDTIADLFTREIEVGIEGTGIKAGIIKVANDAEGVTPQGEIVLRAAARAQKRTGVPISTHSAARERVGDRQVDIFEEEGVDLDRVYIGHSNDTLDIDYLTGIMKRGAWIGLDRYPGGRVAGNPDWEQRTETVRRLMDAGYGDRIMISHDWQVSIHIASREMQEQRHQFNPDGFLFISRYVLPRLRELGATDAVLHQLTVENPRRFFEGRG